MRAEPKLRYLVLFALLASPAWGQTPLSVEEFKRLSDGKTLYFSRAGRFYGAEQYLQNNRTRWQYADGQCTEGRWFGEGNALCFEYEDVPEAQCWIMWEEGGDLLARPLEAPQTVPIELERKDEFPLPCAGPDLGV